jgi:Ca2+/H+ antiporter, TMEM165/GDT1 family
VDPLARYRGFETLASNSPITVLITTFLASAVEAIEMVIIVVGVGATRGWRSTWIGTAGGFGVLAVIVVALGAALSRIPIGPLRLVVGALLLVFGLQWFRKGVMRVAARGFAGSSRVVEDEDEAWTGPGVDWTAFALAFKGVTLEGLEIAFVVVAFGAGANQLGVASIGGVAALVLVGAAGLLLRGVVQRVPRSFLQLIVGVLLTTFGTFWSLEGMGVDWPGSDGAILGLLALYVATAAVYITLERQRAFGLRPAA